MKALWTYWLLTYAELNYWLVGTSPEGYHWAKARAWSRSDDHARAIEQIRRGLEYSDDLRMRCWLAWQLARIGDWSQAAREYAKVAAVTKQPVAVVGWAEAELRLGNKLKAMEVLGTLDKQHAQFTGSLESTHDEIVAACLAKD